MMHSKLFGYNSLEKTVVHLIRIKSALLLFLAVIFIISPSAMAGEKDNEARIDQIGDRHQASATQYGEENSVLIEQSGGASTVSVYQEGTGNAADIQISAVSEISGRTGPGYDLRYNRSAIHIHQEGNHNQAGIDADYGAGSASIHQTGNNNRADITQRAASN